MYNRILVALDGSALAEQILPHAEALGQKFGATLVLLRATVSPTDLIRAEAAAGAMPVVADPTQLAAEDRRDASAYLQALAERVRAVGLSVEVAEPEFGTHHLPTIPRERPTGPMRLGSVLAATPETSAVKLFTVKVCADAATVSPKNKTAINSEPGDA